MNEVTLAESSFTATINVPIERIDLPAWIFGLADDEYQGCFLLMSLLVQLTHLMADRWQ